MAIERIIELPVENNPVAGAAVPIDGATTRQTTIQKLVDAGAPVASQAEAEAGVQATKRMTPLTTKQAVDVRIGVDLQEFSVNLDEVATVNPGAAGLAILADAQTDDVRSYLSTGPYVADITTLKALDSAKDEVATLTAGVPGRQGKMGTFILQLGDFTDEVAADPLGGIYVEPDDRPASEACWVRQFTGRPSVTWWGVSPAETSANNRIYFQAAIDAVCALYPTWERQLEVPNGTTRIGAPPGGNPVGENPSLTIPGSTTLDSQKGQGFTLWAANFRNCQVLFEDETADEACILVEAQEAKFFGLGLIGSDDGDDNWNQYTSGRDILKFFKGPNRTPDVDAVVRWCRFGVGGNGISHTGRGLDCQSNHFSQVNNGIKIAWPDEGQYVPNWINIPSVNYTIVAGVITAMSLGVAYTTTFSVPPAITIRSSNGVGSGATVTPIMSGGTSGTITGFTITNGGTGYTADPFCSRIDPVQSREGGWRGIAIRDNKYQNLGLAALNNTGANRALLNGLIFKSNQLDIGDISIRGHAGTGFDIDGIEVSMTASEGLALCGGFSGTVRGVQINGMGPGQDRNPDNLVRFEATLDGVTDGVFRNCVFADWTLLNSQQWGVIAATGTQFIGCTFDNMKGDAIGFDSPATYSFFRFNGTNSTITFNNMEMIATANRLSYVRNDSATNDIVQRGTKRIGAHTTPFYSGAGAGSVDQRQGWTPATSGLVNISAPSFPAPLDWVSTADEMIELSGRCLLTTTLANTNSIIEMTMPTAELFTSETDASGFFTCTRNGERASGSIVAVVGTNRVLARFMNDTTVATQMGFSVFIRYHRRKA